MNLDKFGTNHLVYAITSKQIKKNIEKSSWVLGIMKCHAICRDAKKCDDIWLPGAESFPMIYHMAINFYHCFNLGILMCDDGVKIEKKPISHIPLLPII